MESRNERHLTTDQLMRLVATVRTLIAMGREWDQIRLDLIQSHGVTPVDLAEISRLI